MVSGRIGVVLPPREFFLRVRSGAVALCARDFSRCSRFAGRIDVIGAGACEYADVSYRRLEGWRRWWRRDRAAYADAVAGPAGAYALLEVQNRPYLIAALKRRRPDLKIALHLHNDPQSMDGSRSTAERAGLLAACAAVYCVSEFIARRFLEGVGDYEYKVATVWNGVPLPPLRADKSPLIAFTGRVARIKGAPELARAFAAAELPGWRLAIAGGDPEGLLKGLASPAIELRGQVPHADALALLDEAEIAAVPSMWDDPCPRAAIEALAHGCALVTTRRGGLPEIAGDAALYVDPSDGQGFAAALRRLAADQGLRRDLQARGRARAEALFAIETATARLDALRARLLGAD